ncbi:MULTISPECIES: catalase family protein [Sphingomonas]|uniref:Catalase n=1 Tax=Sphingomonas adhaesiva TaxID=28212 RepID=A0A2A4IDE0_9SPHN|nr:MULTISPECIES: catalase family protein [Sphingomonas]PCG16148.1 catalase [Sphingomonas adhaesiva]PZU79673.1 MAG: catalase [Sphingomonas sp.]
MQAPVRYTPAVEDVKPDEADVVRQLNEAFDTILETTAKDYGHAVRAVHAKSHGIIEGTLTIDADLPPELAQGLFATPGEHKVFLRLSTNPGDILDDAISLPRGLAMKVLDVEGERLPDAEGTTQDFVMVNATAFQAKSADKFLGNLKLLAKTTDVAEGGKKALSAVLRGVNSALTAVGIESATIRTLGGAPNVDPLGETYFSATAFRYGDHIAKFSLKPVAPGLCERTGAIIDTSGDRDAIRATVREEMQRMDGEWEFRVQLARDPDRQPVEDATVEWDEAEAPFARVGVVRARAQDSWDADRVAAVNEGMRFSVWTGLAAHQPLGNINRARRDTYRHSADVRARVNGCPIHEPTRMAEPA